MEDTPIVATPTVVEPAAPTPAMEPTGYEPELPVQPEPGTGTPADLQPPKTPEQGSEPSEAEKRIKSLVAERNQERERRIFLEGQIEGSKPIVPGTPGALPSQPEEIVLPEVPVRPDVADYENYDQLEAALAQYEKDKKEYPSRLKAYHDQEYWKADEDRKRKSRAAAEQQTAQEAVRTFQSRIKAAAEVDPEIETISHDPTLPVSLAMRAIIIESDIPDKLIRYMHEHKEEARKIVAMSQGAAMREMVKIELSLTSNKEPTNTISKAPEPHQTVNANKGTPIVDYDKIPMDEFVKRRNEAQYGKRR